MTLLPTHPCPMCKNTHTSFWGCRHKVKDSQSECRHQESFTLQLYLLTDSWRDERLQFLYLSTGSSFTCHLFGVQAVGRHTLGLTTQTQIFTCSRYQTPLFHLLSLRLFSPSSLTCERRTDRNSNSWELSASLRSAFCCWSLGRLVFFLILCIWWCQTEVGMEVGATVKDVKSTQHKLFLKLTNDSAMHTHTTPSHTHKSETEAKWSVISRKQVCPSSFYRWSDLQVGPVNTPNLAGCKRRVMCIIPGLTKTTKASKHYHLHLRSVASSPLSQMHVWAMGGSWREPRRHRKIMSTPLRKASGPQREFDPRIFWLWGDTAIATLLIPKTNNEKSLFFFFFFFSFKMIQISQWWTCSP